MNGFQNRFFSLFLAIFVFHFYDQSVSQAVRPFFLEICRVICFYSNLFTISGSNNLCNKGPIFTIIAIQTKRRRNMLVSTCFLHRKKQQSADSQKRKNSLDVIDEMAVELLDWENSMSAIAHASLSLKSCFLLPLRNCR
jgi:hypothetical protein